MSDLISPLSPGIQSCFYVTPEKDFPTWTIFLLQGHMSSPALVSVSRGLLLLLEQHWSMLGMSRSLDTQIWISVPPLTSSVTSVKLVSHMQAVPLFLHLENGSNKWYLPHHFVAWITELTHVRHTAAIIIIDTNRKEDEGKEEEEEEEESVTETPTRITRNRGRKVFFFF